MLRKILFLFWVSLQITAYSQWTHLGGPNIGSVHDIINTGSYLVLYTFNSGIYVSSDDGNTWERSSNGLPCNHGITAFTSDKGAWYVSLNQNGIYRSLDHGLNWVSVSSEIDGMTFYQLAVKENQIVAANSEGGIYFSPNDGVTWLNKSSGIADIQFSDISFNQDKVFISGKFLFSSSDQGDHWVLEDIPGLNLNGIMDLLIKDGVYYASTEGGVFISYDNLSSWIKRPLPVSGATINSLSSFGTRIFATTSLGRYFYSDDQGVSWQPGQHPLTSSSVNRLIANDQRYFMGTDDGLFISRDHGVSWNKALSGNTASQIESLAANDQFVFAGAENQGIFRYDIQQGQWTGVSSGLEGQNALHVEDIHIFEDKLVIATGGGIYTSNDWGANWQRTLDPGLNLGAQALAEDNGVMATAVGNSGLFLSRDQGVTWTKPRNNGLSVNSMYESILLKGNMIVLSDHDARLFITSDLGENWHDISISGDFEFVYDLEIKDNIIYAATNNGLKMSSDMGLSWSSFNSDKQVLRDIVFDGNVLYAAGEFGTFVTTVEHKEWYQLCTGIEKQYTQELLLTKEYLYAGTFNSGVWQRSKISNILSIADQQEGILLNSLSLCPGGSKIDLSKLAGIGPGNNGSWFPALSSGDNIFDPSQDMAGRYSFKSMATSCGCEENLYIDINFDGALNPVEDSVLELCRNDGPLDLLLLMNKDPNSVGTWTPELTSGTNVFDPEVDAAGIYIYQIDNGQCGIQKSVITINIAENPVAGVGQSVVVCHDSGKINLFDQITGEVDVEGEWSPSLSSGGSMFDPSSDSPGNYTYTVSNGICADSSTVEVIVEPEPNPGQGTDLLICRNESPISLFTKLTGSPDSGGTWTSPVGVHNGIFDPVSDGPGIYEYQVNGFCGSYSSEIYIAITDVEKINNVQIETEKDGNLNAIVVETEPMRDFEFSIDGEHFQKSNRFDRLPGGNYTVTGKEVGGCGMFQEQIRILGYPSFFTPNGDGKNDRWNPIGVGEEVFDLYIFDRFGKLLVSADKNFEGWDGVYNGHPMPSTDYWFRIVFENGDFTVGHFSLQR